MNFIQKSKRPREVEMLSLSLSVFLFGVFALFISNSSTVS